MGQIGRVIFVVVVIAGSIWGVSFGLGYLYPSCDDGYIQITRPSACAWAGERVRPQ